VLALVGFATLGTVVALPAVHRGRRPHRVEHEVTTVVGVVAGLYAVLVTFVIVNEWQTYNDAQAHVSAEAAALTALSFDVSVLPESSRSTIRDAVLAVTRASGG
jgi:hypothetical protein